MDSTPRARFLAGARDFIQQSLAARQNLNRHVHLHCLVPGGALRSNGTWKATKGNYLFPVKALSRRFRGRMVDLLRRAASHGELARVTRH